MKTTPKYILAFLGIAILIFILWYFMSIVAYILIAAVISLIGQPLVSLIRRIKIKGFQLPKWLCAALTLVFIWFLIFIFFSVFVPLVASQANELSNINVQAVITNLQGPIQELEQFLAEMNVGGGTNFSVKDYATEKIIEILQISHISNFLGSFAGTLGDIFVAIFSISFISFFFLKEEKLFSNAILAFVPNQYIEEAKHVMASIHRLLKRYFIGVLIEVFSVCLLNTIGLSIVGLKFENALLIALFAGVMNVIPYIGPIIGATFGVVIGIATNLQLDFYTELTPLIGLMLLVFVSVQIIDNIVFQPLIYSNSVNAHPLEIFLVILMAGNLAGIVGMVLAIPSYTILRVIAKEFFNGIKVIQQLTRNM